MQLHLNWFGDEEMNKKYQYDSEFGNLTTFDIDYIKNYGEEIVGDYLNSNLTPDMFRRWTEIFSDYHLAKTGNFSEKDALKWCQTNIKNDWNSFNGTWFVFEDVNDCMLFKLTWR